MSKAAFVLAMRALGCVIGLGWSAGNVHAAPEKPSPLPPLPAGSGFSQLPVAGFLPAVVAWPAAATSRGLPIVVALHGSYDQPEWNCAVYQQVVRGAAVVLCPRGRLRWDTPSNPAELRFFFPSTGGWIFREVDAALRALKESAPGRIAAGPVVYAGFSQGAILAAPLLPSRGAQFSRAILVEGGASWTNDSARAYARSGGQRVLFACGQAGCYARARASSATLEKAGVHTQATYAPDQGHTYDGGVQADLKKSFAWLVEGDARFVFGAD